MFKWLALRTVLVLFGLAAGLLLLEIALRATGINPVPMSKRTLIAVGKKPLTDYHCYPANPHGEFKPAPDLSQGKWRLIDFTKHEFPLAAIQETPWVVEYDYSPQGIRDRLYTGQPSAGTMRIAGLGASFALGEGVPIEHSLFRQVERKLGAGYEVVNAARCGMKTIEMVQLLPKLVEGVGCGRALVVFTPSDILLTDELERREEYINDFVNLRDQIMAGYLRGGLIGQSRALSTLLAPLAMRRVGQRTQQWYLDCYDPKLNGKNLALMQEHLRALAARQDCPAVLVMYPLLIGFEHGYPLTPIHQTIGRMAREAGLPVLDLAETFRGQKTQSLWVFDTDHHPNGRAHALAAEAIASWLRGEVPSFLASSQPGRS